MPTPNYAHYMLDLGLKYDGADMTDGDIINISAVCPFAGTIKEVWLGVGKTLPTTATVAVSKAASTNISIVSAVTISGYTVNVAQSATLTTASAALKVAAGDMLLATWTLTDITVADDSAFACTVIIEPDAW